MSNPDDFTQKAKQYLISCDHILTTTYPVLRDVKLLARCIEYLFLAMTNVMSEVLTQEREKRAIPPFQPNFKSKIQLFTQIAQSRGFDAKDVAFIKELHILITFHKKSAMEFTKNNELVICSDEFDTKRISENSIKDYLKHARTILAKI